MYFEVNPAWQIAASLTIRTSTGGGYGQLRRNDAAAGSFADIDIPARPR
jgi:hypothetical protein